MKIVLGMVMIEGSRKEVEKMLDNPEVRELLLIQRDSMDSRKDPKPMTYYVPYGNTTGNV